MPYLIIENEIGYLPESEPIEVTGLDEAADTVWQLLAELEDFGYIFDNLWNLNLPSIVCEIHVVNHEDQRRRCIEVRHRE